MNVGTFTTPTARGQIVIPAAMRKSLGINEDTLLQIKVVGDGIYLHPAHVIPKLQGDNGALLAVLQRVKGSWGPETPEEKKQAKAQRRLELAATRKSKAAW